MEPSTRRNTSFPKDVQQLIAKGYHEAGGGELVFGVSGYRKLWKALRILGVDIGESGSPLREKVRKKTQSFYTKDPDGNHKPTNHYLDLLDEIGIPRETVVGFGQAIENNAYSKKKGKEKKRKEPSKPSTGGSKKPPAMEYKEKKRKEASTPSTGGSKKPSAMEYTSPLAVANSAGFSSPSTNPTKTPFDQPTPITTPDGRHSVSTFPVPSSWSSASRRPSFASSSVARMPARGSATTPSAKSPWSRNLHLPVDSPLTDLVQRRRDQINATHYERRASATRELATLTRDERARKAQRRAMIEARRRKEDEEREARRREEIEAREARENQRRADEDRRLAQEAEEDDALLGIEVSALRELGQVADAAHNDDMNQLIGSLMATDTIHEADEAVDGFESDEPYAALESNGEVPNLDRPALESDGSVALESYVATEGNDDVSNWDRPALEPTGDVALDSGGDPEPEYRDDADEEPSGSSDKIPSPDRPALASTVDVAADPQDENRAVGTYGAKTPKRGWFGGIL